jgi:hypothetical protein
MNKQEIIDFLNSDETYNKVLELINNECQLDGTHINAYPPEYFIAGGSVANTIYFLLNKHKFQKPVINDVDFFSFEENVDGRILHEENFIHVGINEKPQYDGYGGVWFGSFGEYFSMLRSEREGIVNKIIINVRQHTVKGLDFDFCYKTTIENFDLNCCGAGLDRLNKRIVYTDSFVWFLMNNKIEVTVINNPIQTTIRMFNKSNELKTDDSGFLDEVLLLQHCYYTVSSNWTIGPIWREKLKQHTNLVEQFYELNKMVMESGFYFDDSVVYMPKKIDLKINIDEIIFDEKSLLFFWDLFVRGKNDLLKDRLLEFYNVIDINPFKTRSEPGEITFDISKYTKKITPINYLNSMTDLDVSVDDLVKVNEFFVKIQNDMPLVNVIRMFKLGNIQDQIKFIEFISSTIKDEFNDFSYGKFFNLVKSNSMYPNILNCLKSEKLKDKLEFFKKGSVNTIINPRIKYHHI